MRVAILTNQAAPGLDAIVAKPHDLFEVSSIVRASKVPKNLRGREDHDRDTADLLLSLETNFVFLLGYPYVITDPLLAAFPQKIVVVHDGDLTRRDEAGARRWTGLQAVREAILAGETSTRTSLFFATERVGEGPLFLQSHRYEVAPLARAAIGAGDYDSACRYAGLHRAWMRRDWGALFVQAVEHLALGDVRVAGDTVWIDGVPGPCRHADAPDLCYELGEAIQRGVPSSCPFVRQRG